MSDELEKNAPPVSDEGDEDVEAHKNALQKNSLQKSSLQEEDGDDVEAHKFALQKNALQSNEEGKTSIS
jgi:hypothetical protein